MTDQKINYWPSNDDEIGNTVILGSTREGKTLICFSLPSNESEVIGNNVVENRPELDQEQEQ